MNTREDQAIGYLRDPKTIRNHCNQILELAKKGQLEYFRFHPDRLQQVIGIVTQETLKNYPDKNIPDHSRWRHFDIIGSEELDRRLSCITTTDKLERGKHLIELTFVSVLLDAGAGANWMYLDPINQRYYSRSEGLAVASLNMFTTGYFSSFKHPAEVDADGLLSIDAAELGTRLQVSHEKTLVGLDERVQVLHRLGHILKKSYMNTIGNNPIRLSKWVDDLLAHSKKADRFLSAKSLMISLLNQFSTLWPSEILIGSQGMGDVWRHPAIQGNFDTNGLIPFHKLTQWLTYSLVEPLRGAGIEVIDLEELTGLPEYRNGGLLLDSGLISLRNQEHYHESHNLDSTLVVEWRALTVAILDLIANGVRHELKMSSAQLPLSKILQGGTWTAGRRLAKAKRPKGDSPLRINLQGSFF